MSKKKLIARPIGTRIREARGSMTQADLAAAVGLSQNRVSELESDRCDWEQLDLLRRLATTLGVSVHELIGD